MFYAFIIQYNCEESKMRMIKMEGMRDKQKIEMRNNENGEEQGR